MKIETASNNHFKKLVEICSTCFVINYDETTKAIKTDKRSKIEDFYISIENKSITGCLKIYRFDTFIREEKLRIGGIASVAVLPEYRRKGIADELVKKSLQEMYKRKYPISMLYPFQHRFYRKYGWEFVGPIIRYNVSPNNIINLPGKDYIRSWNMNDRQAIKNVFIEKSKKSSCSLLRNDNFWKENIFPSWEKVIVYDEQTIQGYLVYELIRGANFTDVKIKEFVALNYESYCGILSFLASLGDQVNKIEYFASIDEPIYNFLKEPVDINRERIFFEYKSLGTFAPGFMMRVVNLKEALLKVGKCNLEKFRISFKISDPHIEPNNKPFTIVGDGNGIEIFEKEDKNILVETDINSFSQMYSGLITASKLRWYGKIKCSEKVASLCDNIFKTSTPFIYQADVF